MSNHKGPGKSFAAGVGSVDHPGAQDKLCSEYYMWKEGGLRKSLDYLLKLFIPAFSDIHVHSDHPG